MPEPQRKLAVVTGASTGIGLELARECAKNEFDLLIAANESELKSAADELRREGGRVDMVQVDLATTQGVDQLYAKIGGRPAAAFLMALEAGPTAASRLLPSEASLQVSLYPVVESRVDHTPAPPCVGTWGLRLGLRFAVMGGGLYFGCEMPTKRRSPPKKKSPPADENSREHSIGSAD
jgi:short chain dehydrogenase